MAAPSAIGPGPLFRFSAADAPNSTVLARAQTAALTACARARSARQAKRAQQQAFAHAMIRHFGLDTVA